MARISLEELRAAPPQADMEKLNATTEADIRRYTVEDGQDPDADLVGYRLVPAPAEIRKKLGQTQQEFAETIGVPVATYRNWEQGRKTPDPAALSLLKILDREPEAAMRALQTYNVVPKRSRAGMVGAKVIARFKDQGAVSVVLFDANGKVIGQTDMPKTTKRTPAKPRRSDMKPVRA